MASLGRMSAVGACLFCILTVSAGEKISLVDAIVATSDASGQVVGTFSGVDATEAAFNGFQVAGTSFPDVQPAGLLMILR